MREMSSFPDIDFAGSLRPSQTEIARISQEQLDAGNRRLNIVAPPGAGKTVVGLYVWSQLVRQRALVLSPNSAIQAQWAARTELFVRNDGLELAPSISTQPDKPGLLTSLTYQSVTLPASASEESDSRAIELWIDTLLQKEQSDSRSTAEDWIEDLRIHNRDYFNERLATYRRKLRDDVSTSDEVLAGLHASSIEKLQSLHRAGVGLLILDECHHLMGHWGRVLAAVAKLLGNPVVLGLTATPPDREKYKAEDVERYDEFFAEVDYEVPLPAVVKDGFLAPYQDLAYFVRPTNAELEFIANVDNQFAAMLDEFCVPRQVVDPDAPVPEYQRQSLLEWLWDVLRDHSSTAEQWSRFYNQDKSFANAAVRFLIERIGQTPDGVPPIPPGEIDLESMTKLISHYTRKCLRRSPSSEDHELAKLATKRLRMLGVQITETGSRPCASPVSRVIAYTKSKAQALVPVLRTEQSNLGDAIRAVVITDFEKSSAITSDISHLLDEEAGGAIAAFRAVLSDEKTNELDPILLTGSTVLVDRDMVDAFLNAATTWLTGRGANVELRHTPQDDFCIIKGSGGDWCPRVYVEMITALFQRGLTRCLVGTRGLLGEGWDATKINVLVDLSTFTTSTTVNQLRGRSIRLDPTQPNKLANNWDIVCIAPEFSQGFGDYHRFIRKHKTVFGICDDGAIEKGVGHVHAAFNDLLPNSLQGNVDDLNAEMLTRSSQRDEIYDRWSIGEPYSLRPIRCVEIQPRIEFDDQVFLPFDSVTEPLDEKQLVAVIAKCVLDSLVDAKLADQGHRVHQSSRSGGFFRLYLKSPEACDAQAARQAAIRFAQGVHDAFSQAFDARYVIPRSVETRSRSWLASRVLPEFIGKLLERRQRHVAMLHGVPADLARKRELVDVYQRRWNQHVSVGQAVFATNSRGEKLIQTAIENSLLTGARVHEKEVFV